MPLTNAEKCRRYREKLKADEVNNSLYLNKEKERNKKRKKNPASEMTERALRAQRKEWRHRKQRSRAAISDRVPHDTPPATPSSVVQIPDLSSAARRAGRKKIRRERAKAYREIERLKKQLEKKSRIADKFRKRYERSVRQNTKKQVIDTPRTKTRKLLRNFTVSSEVKRTLTFHHVLVADIKAKWMASGRREKQIMSKAVGGKLLRKYRMIALASKNLRIRIRKNLADEGGLKYFREKQSNATSAEMFKRVLEFLERDDSSRQTSGKKETITKKGDKKQKRFLLDSLRNTHLKFLAENADVELSYSMFCRMKPFWILLPSDKDRNTCLCKLHANSQYVAETLYREGILSSPTLESTLSLVACDTNRKQCMYRECSNCKDRSIVKSKFEESKMVSFFQWQTKKVEYTGSDNKTATTIRTVKELSHLSLENIVIDFDITLTQKLARHVFNIKNQYKALRILKEKLSQSNKDCIIHIDFSENYSCQYGEEIQAVHFGSSHQQASLHTGIVYTRDEIMPFCTVSACTRHDPAGIWAHLDPILNHLRATFPEIQNLHFVSDGPTTQYRNRNNFYLFSHIIFEKGFITGTWNFMEAGHGKGAPDGIGASVKRKCDAAIAHGIDVKDAKDVFSVISNSESTVRTWLIEEESIRSMSAMLENREICVVPGTMKIHQIVCSAKNTIRSRVLSCYCSHPDICTCMSLSDDRILASSFKPVADAPISVSNIDSISPLEVSVPGVAMVSQRQASLASHIKILNVDDIVDDIIGTHCVLKYDGKVYPGVVLDVDSDGTLEVKCMHRIGENRFYWPMIDDVLWYKCEDIVSLISEPTHVTKRHMQVDPTIWQQICEIVGI